jgi:3-methyladenine DNA glycosylase AlkD
LLARALNSRDSQACRSDRQNKNCAAKRGASENLISTMSTDPAAAREILNRLGRLANKRRAKFLEKLFKTGGGQYGEGDIFLGIRVPALRQLADEYRKLSMDETLSLLRSRFHEARLFALIVLTRSFANADEVTKTQIYKFYLQNTKYINNWDLVDVSAPRIVGAFLMDKSKTPLYTLAKSPNLWERRIAIIATAHFIRHDRFIETLKIAELLLADEHDLIHKAVGWMLREIGRRDSVTEEEFLRIHYRRMPRTMLRYSIERFPRIKRQKYLKGSLSGRNSSALRPSYRVRTYELPILPAPI